MTIPKNAGLSHLADVANPIEHYPVKRRGQRRRLVPNWDAIRWLEDEQHDDTEITDERVLGDTDEWAEMNMVRALGWYGAKQRGHYPRRMFDVFELGASSSNMIAYTPCEACDDFSRTWACAEHPEVAWDTKRRTWVRPGTAVWYELHPEDQPTPPERQPDGQPTVYVDTGARPPGAGSLYDRMIEMFGQPLPTGSSPCTCSMCQPGAARPSMADFFRNVAETPADPNRGRPGYHYDFATDRWQRDTGDALADFRAGGEVGGTAYGFEVSLPEISADERLSREWERQNGIPLADALRNLDRVPDELGPTRRTFIDRLLGDLPDFSVTLNGTFTLEITGDTTEASASTVRIEVERNDDTTA